jgi:hypothetical protein
MATYDRGVTIERGSWLAPTGLALVLAALLVALVVGGLALRHVGAEFTLSDAQQRRIETACERRAQNRSLTGDRLAHNITFCLAGERAARTPELPPN